jgi:hypothetical protein
MTPVVWRRLSGARWQKAPSWEVIGARQRLGEHQAADTGLSG